MPINIRMLQANHGDCFFITYSDDSNTFNVLIDGGNKTTFSYGARQRYSGALKLLLDEIKGKNQCVDLLILSHFDDDHIGGLIRGYETKGYLQEIVKRVWFNSSLAITNYFKCEEIIENEILINSESAQTTPEQGATLEKLLIKTDCELIPILTDGSEVTYGPFTFKILSPTQDILKKLLCIWPKDTSNSETSGAENDYNLTFDELDFEEDFEEDGSLANESSIAFIMEAEGKKMLFLGDAHNKTIINSLKKFGYNDDNKLDVELMKISHHASKNNTSRALLNIVNAKNYLISSNGVKKGAVSKRTIHSIIKTNDKALIWFNYKEIIEKIISNESEKEAYKKKLLDFNNSGELSI